MTDPIHPYPGKKLKELFTQETEYFKQMVAIRPNEVSGYVGLAESYINLWCYGFITGDDSLPQAREIIEQAMELNDTYGMMHAIAGVLKLSEWDWQGAEKAFRTAIELDSDNYKSRHWYALYLSAMGRHKAAIRESKISESLAPPSGSKIGYASILYFAHEFAQMVEVLEKAVIDEAEFASVYDWLGMAYVQLKQFDKSIEIYQKAVTLSDGLAEIKAGLGHAYGMAGKTAEARAVLDELLSLAEVYYVPPVQIAFVALGLEENQLAFDLLEKAYLQRSWELVFLRTEPWFDDYHSDPRFQDLIRRLNFPKKRDLNK